MSVSAVGFADPFPRPEAAAAAAQPGGTGEAFAKVVTEFLSDVNMEQFQADLSVERLVTGKTADVHETMLALSRADLSFRLFMEVRNKAIEAYQEIMRMQV